MSTPDDRVVDLANQQWGVVTRAQARECGLSLQQIRYRLQRHSWMPLGSGAFMVATNSADKSWDAALVAERRWRAQTIAACLVLRGVASHRTAAWLWGLGDYRQGSVEITVERSGYRRRPGVDVYSSTQFSQMNPSIIAGIPTAGIERTLLDLASVIDRHELTRLIAKAVQLRSTTMAHLCAEVAEHSKRGRPGITRIRQGLAAANRLNDELPGRHEQPEPDYKRP